MPAIKPNPVTSKDVNQDTMPQLDYSIPTKIDPKTNKPINLPTMFKFKEQTFSIVHKINQKEFMKIDTLKLKNKEHFSNGTKTSLLMAFIK
eukprot:9574432-Ditylum_brightwellii.AAC.1